MINKKKCLVLLATYQGGNWIGQQITSLAKQLDDVDLHLLVSDDASTDNTLCIIREMAEQQHISYEILTREKSSGSSSANFISLMKAADASKFQYIFLCDQDDIWLPGKMRAAIDALDVGDFQGYSCAVTAFWPNGQKKNLIQSDAITAADYLFEGGGQGCTFAMTRQLFELVQLFLRNHADIAGNFKYHDWLIYMVARCIGYSWYFDARSWMYYRQHGGNVIGAKGKWAGAKSRILLIKSGWYRNEVYKAICIAEEAGARGGVCLKFKRLLLRRRSSTENLYLAMLMIRHSRRKFAERIVLCIAAMLYWI